MITQQEISGLLNQQVLGSSGQKIGQAKHVFYDDATGRPEWVTVKTGMLGGNETFIPIRDAVASEGHLKVPYSKDKIKSAPNVDVDAKGHLSAQEERRLYSFYGIDGSAPGPRAAGQQRMGNEQRAAADQRAAGQVSGQAASQRAAEEQQAAAPRAAAPQAGADAAMSADAGLADDAMTLSEEKMHVRVERRESGQARLHKYIESEEREETIPLRHEEARLIREPITDANRGDAVAGPELSESDHVVTLHAEKPVVETTVEPTERVRLAVEEHTEQQTVRGTVRREQIRIEDAPDDDQSR
ncbi:DUF2382 domain-containing protein [Actinospica robiniae]|uniref:DUF2382 domain-containing protein n=1 Tax=Actinospica robiniae TaxID=304901 RepID=UPI0003F50CA8|nr:PRC and DUF2382 domain-containing protein [Actinospica robiniae]